MINVRRVNISMWALMLLGLVSVIWGEIVGHRAVTVITYLLVGIPLPYLFIRRDMRKLDLRVMNGKYHWLIDKAFAGEKRSYKKLLLSLGYLELDKPKKASRVVRKLKPLCYSRGDVIRVSIVEGMCLMMAKQYQQAYVHFSAILEAEPSYATVWVYQSINLMAMGEFEGAEKMCEIAFRYDAKNVWTYIGMSLVSLGKGQYETALQYAKDAQKMNPEESIVLAVIGCCYGCMGDTGKRRSYLEEFSKKVMWDLKAFVFITLKKSNRYAKAFRL